MFYLFYILSHGSAATFNYSAIAHVTPKMNNKTVTKIPLALLSKEVLNMLTLVVIRVRSSVMREKSPVS